MSLSDKQQIFALLISRFIVELYARGYKVTLGESFRPCETAELYAKEGKGIANSLHTRRLAEDLNLFKDGRFLTSLEEYREAGELWMSYSTDEYDCAWGGSFERPDADHFSIADGGQR